MARLGRKGVVLVTGATGFIGRALCEALTARGERVRALARSPADGPWESLLRIDLGRERIPAADLTGVSIVYHLAGYAHDISGFSGSGEVHRRVNVDGTRVLLDACAQAAVRRFVFLSSVKAMGEGGEDCLDETYPPMPESPYGRSKLEAERLVLAYGPARSAHVVVLRPCLVFGPGCKGNLARMVGAVTRGRFPPVCDIGDRRSMVHVDDLVAAALLSAEHEAASGKVYIVTDGQTYSTRDVFVAACAALGRPPPRWCVPLSLLRFGARLGDLAGRIGWQGAPLDTPTLRKLTESAWFSARKIERELGYRATRTLATGMQEMVAGAATLAPEKSP